MGTTSAEELPADAPMSLSMMAAVVGDQQVDHVYYRAFEELLKKDPAGFAKKHADLETAYWVARKPEGGAPSVLTRPSEGQECPCCGEVYWPAGCERALESGRDWLERNKG